MPTVQDTSATIDISGLDKASVLKALYDNAQCLGMGILQFESGDMPIEEAHDIIAYGSGNSAGDYACDVGPRLYFDYFKGRVMKVDLSGDTLNTWGYDRDNGEGAARRALSPLLNP
jgi:hypothetical protein